MTASAGVAGYLVGLDVAAVAAWTATLDVGAEAPLGFAWVGRGTPTSRSS